MTTPKTKEQVISHALSFRHGGMTGDELGLLYDLCPGADVIEVGSMVGMSSYVIASVASRVICCDLWTDTHEHIEPRQREIYDKFSKENPEMFEMFKANTAPFRHKITWMRGLSWEMAKLINNALAHVILFDADHSYEGVKRDFHAYAPKLTPGGLMFFHDCNSVMWPGVSQFINEQGENFQLVKQVGHLAAFRLFS